MSNDNLVLRKIKLQKLRRKAKRVEMTTIKVYKLIRFIFSIVIIICVYKLALSHLWYLPNDIYTNKNTQSLEILGNKIVKKDKIISVMQRVQLPHKPIYKINTAEITREIEQLPPVRRAYVRRFWLPARIVVMIEEENPVFVIAPSEDAPDVAAFSIDGHIIPKEYLPLSDSFKTTKILSYGNNGDDYKKWNKDKISMLYQLTKSIEQYSGEQVIYIDLRQPNNVFVQIKSVKIRLGELDNTVSERIKAIYDILPKIKTMNESIKYVDLSWRESRYLKLNR